MLVQLCRAYRQMRDFALAAEVVYLQSCRLNFA